MSDSCDPLNTLPSNLPANYDTNSTFLCGISYPAQQPLETLQICCTAPIEISNDCFQYCPASGRESTIFSSCVEAHVDEVDQTGFKVRCNAGTEVPAVEAESNGADAVMRGWKMRMALAVGVAVAVGFGRVV